MIVSGVSPANRPTARPLSRERVFCCPSKIRRTFVPLLAALFALLLIAQPILAQQPATPVVDVSALERATTVEPVARAQDELQDPLSAREREVLQLIAQGRSNREIAQALFVTEHTVKYHVTSLFNRLDVTSRAEAVGRAAALGLLPDRTGADDRNVELN